MCSSTNVSADALNWKNCFPHTGSTQILIIFTWVSTFITPACNFSQVFDKIDFYSGKIFKATSHLQFYQCLPQKLLFLYLYKNRSSKGGSVFESLERGIWAKRVHSKAIRCRRADKGNFCVSTICCAWNLRRARRGNDTFSSQLTCLKFVSGWKKTCLNSRLDASWPS